jgi:hypothetical protein
MSIHTEILRDITAHNKCISDLYIFWQLLAEYLPANILDLPFSSYYFRPEFNPPTLELTFHGHDETWMDRMRTLFASEANVFFSPVVSAGLMWNRTRIKSEGIIYEDSVSCERPALKIVLLGPPTAKCRMVKVTQHVEEQEYIEAHDEEVDAVVCGDNIPTDAILAEED